MASLFKLCRLATARSSNVFNRFGNLNTISLLPSTARCFSDDTKSTKSINLAATVIKPTLRPQYVPITEETATIILDVEEEREKLESARTVGNFESPAEFDVDQYDGLNLERGINGVFDIEDLVEVLRRDNGIDIFVSQVPSHLKYVDYICVVTARSPRHMKAIAEFVRKMYKVKRTQDDLIPRLEGKGSGEWVAMDMGNIALHIFTSEAREKYDIEQLWSVGPEFDAESNKPDDAIVQMFERHAVYLSDLTSAYQSKLTQPTEDGGKTKT